MAKTDILDYSTTPAENQDINGVSILGTAKPSNLDDAQRAQMSHIAKGLVTRRSAKDTAYTAVKADHNQILDFTEEATLTTSSAATLKDGWMCYIYASGGAVTVNPNGSETVNGDETATVKEGGMAILRVYDGNFLLSFFIGGGGGSSEILYDEETVTFTTADPLVITGITEDMRAVEIEVEATGASPNPGTVNLFAEPGDGSTFATNGQSPVALWTNGGTGERRGFCTVKNLDDPDLGIYIQSYPHSTGGSTSLVATIIPPAVFASRPITEIRLRPVPSSGTTSVTLSKCRVRGIRS